MKILERNNKKIRKELNMIKDMNILERNENIINQCWMKGMKILEREWKYLKAKENIRKVMKRLESNEDIKKGMKILERNEDLEREWKCEAHINRKKSSQVLVTIISVLWLFHCSPKYWNFLWNWANIWKESVPREAWLKFMLQRQLFERE